MNFTSTQKKIVGLAIAILFIILNGFLLLMLVASVVMYPQDASQNIIQFMFSIALFSFPLFHGLKMYNAGKSELIPLVEPIDRGKILRLNVHLSFHEYRKLIMLLTYKHPVMLFLTLIGLVLVLLPLFTTTGFTNVSYIGVVLILLPPASWIQARRQYDSNKPLSEKIEYVFTPDNISLTGQTFNTTISWESLYKVKEMRDWFLLYTNRQVAFVIPKSAWAEEDIAIFRSFVINVKSILKEF